MSTPKPASNTVGIVAAAAVIIFAMACVVALQIAVPEGANTFSLIALLLGQVPGAIAALMGLQKSTQANATLHQLANGLGDAKHRAAIADVVKPEFLRDDVDDQLAADNVRRERGTDPA